jgi:hypothetical protein
VVGSGHGCFLFVFCPPRAARKTRTYLASELGSRGQPDPGDRRLGNNALQHATPRRGPAGMPSAQPIRLPPTYGLRRAGELAARLLILCAYCKTSALSRSRSLVREIVFCNEALQSPKNGSVNPCVLEVEPSNPPGQTASFSSSGGKNPLTSSWDCLRPSCARPPGGPRISSCDRHRLVWLLAQPLALLDIASSGCLAACFGAPLDSA